MANITPKSLQDYLDLEYPFNVMADPDGGYVIDFPDLPGCMTQADTIDEIVPMAEDARRLWIEAEYESGEFPIPLPSYLEEYSGKFNVRLPRSLHRKLAESAERENVSLNSYVVEILSRGDVQRQLGHQLGKMEEKLDNRLGNIEEQLDEIRDSIRYSSTGVPSPSKKSERFQVVHDDFEAVAA